jgi:hypothetical protein
VGLLTILTALAWAGSNRALAQLSPADIAALQERGKAEGWTFIVTENDATRRPKHELCGAVEPPDWRLRARFDPCTPRRDLPPAFDWRTLPGFPAIRDQGGCGSCWAFAATGAMECAILIDQGLSLNLAEQWLVSCTNAGDCGGGWAIEAYEFVRCNGRQDPCGGNGVVLESDFPYVAYNAPCNCPYPHPFCLDSWAAIGPEWHTPSVAQIKQAILDHGPVSTSVCTNSPFYAYGGGIFNACTDGPVDHDVVLVGWDDNQGPAGVWILRNSWGPGWGESGYMRIAYGCSRIGYGAAYVEYNLPDCNGNGVRDADDIANGTSQDCNKNGIPDECDLATGTSQDCNANGVPDECDLAWPLPALVNDVDAVLDWVEISGTGTPLNLSNDGVAEVPLPFINALFRNGPVMVGNDGALAFGGPPWLPYWNSPIPSGALFGGEPALAPFWDDLGATTGNVYWQTLGTPPGRTFIVEWYNRPYSPGDYVIDGDEVTFEVQVFETPASGVFAQYLYVDTNFLDPAHNYGASASVGFQMDGANGCQWSYHALLSISPGLVLSVLAQTPPASADVNLNGVPDECERGDMNCDGTIDFADINPFVLYLSNIAVWQATYANCPLTNGDINGDGTYGQASFGDINPFVALLTGG